MSDNEFKRHFTYKNLIRFTVFPIIMMLFTSIYSVVDGFFISNFAGKYDFTGVNFILPYIYILSGIGIMFGSGGSALIGKYFGEGNYKKGNEIYSFSVVVSFILGILFSLLSYFFLDKIFILFNTPEVIIKPAKEYAVCLLIALPFFILEMEGLSFLLTAERPEVGLYVKILAGVINIALDCVFVIILKMGALGAGIATALNQIAAGVVSFLFFVNKKSRSTIHFCFFKPDFRSLFKVMSNGLSELVSSISGNLVGLLFNLQLLKYSGENGVAAFGVLMYINFIFASIFFGYSSGVIPIISYQYGAKNDAELKNLLKKSLIIITFSSLFMFITSLCLSRPLSYVFVGYDKELFALTLRGFKIFTFIFLIMGYNTFISSFFTALNNGIISALITFLRSLVFSVIAVYSLPLIFGGDGIWFSQILSEALSLVIGFILLLVYRKKYNY